MTVEKLNNKKFKILDCTLRDGGYYNNWNFSIKLIQDYLNIIQHTEIKFIELGFRNFKTNRNFGPTGYTDDRLINKLNFPKLLKIGVMVNASELRKNCLTPLKNLKRLFPKINKKISFVRFACHYDEVFFLKDCIKWLSKHGVLVFINIMQVSEIDSKILKKICYFLKDKDIKALYFADSLGALNSKKIKLLKKDLKSFWSNKDVGLHAHDNLNLAFKNSKLAVKNNFKWIDSTIMGMGRGPGNLKTEDILKLVKRDQLKFINKLKMKYFKNLKKKYKWGTNSYYKQAAIKKIHPTYVQQMLADNRYNKKNYKIIISNLSKENSKKFNPHKLFIPNNIYASKKKGKWSPFNDLSNKKILILGPGENIKKNKTKIIRFIKDKRPFVIALNSFNSLQEKLVNVRAICHPKRIISDFDFLNRVNTPIIAPISSMPEKLKNYLKLDNKIIFDFGLHLNGKKKIFVGKNYCSIPKPLVFFYSLSVAISAKAKKIYLAGFDGYKNDDPFSDETNHYLKKFLQTYGKLSLITITKSKYKIPPLKL